MNNINQLRVNEDAVNYLQVSKVQGEDEFLEALANIAKEKGFRQFSNKSGLNRENLYRTLKAGAKPRYTTIEKVLSALGIASKLILVETIVSQKQ